MKQSIIINVITLITFGIMKAAWELATEGQKMHGGKKSEYLGESMRQAWAVKKAGGTQEAALKAGGYELTQRHKEAVRKLKQETALAAQKETHNDSGDAVMVAEYLGMNAQPKAVIDSRQTEREYALSMDAPTAPVLNAEDKATMFDALKNTFGGQWSSPKRQEPEDYSQDPADYATYESADAVDMDCISQDENDWTKCARCHMPALKTDIRPKAFRAGGKSVTETCCGKCRDKIELLYNRIPASRKAMTNATRGLNNGGTYWNKQSPARAKFLADELEAAFRK